MRIMWGWCDALLACLLTLFDLCTLSDCAHPKCANQGLGFRSLRSPRSLSLFRINTQHKPKHVFRVVTPYKLQLDLLGTLVAYYTRLGNKSHVEGVSGRP